MCFSDLASNLPDLQKSMLTSCHLKANLCCVLLSVLSCLNAESACSSVQGTLTCGSCPGVAAAMPASSACRASMLETTSCNMCNCFWTGGLQIWQEIHLRLNKSVSSKLKSSHPLLQVHCTSVVFHELHESMQEHCFGPLDEMQSQESFEIVHTGYLNNSLFSSLCNMSLVTCRMLLMLLCKMSLVTCHTL